MTAGIPDPYSERFFERFWLKMQRRRADGTMDGRERRDGDVRIGRVIKLIHEVTHKASGSHIGCISHYRRNSDRAAR